MKVYCKNCKHYMGVDKINKLARCYYDAEIKKYKGRNTFIFSDPKKRNKGNDCKYYEKEDIKEVLNYAKI